MAALVALSRIVIDLQIFTMIHGELDDLCPPWIRASICGSECPFVPHNTATLTSLHVYTKLLWYGWTVLQWISTDYPQLKL
jgi:hypothetical protein